MLKIIKAKTVNHYEQMRELTVQYAAALGFDLEFQEFSRELSTLPGDYSAPSGCILLAKMDDRYTGCVAIRDIGDATCEMKRLYVMPKYRGRKIGRILVEAVVKEAQTIGYERMRLDTVETMVAANKLYGSLGFYIIDAYYNNPLENVVYYELGLKQRHKDRVNTLAG